MSVSTELLKKIEASIDEVSLKEEFNKKGEILEIKDGVATVI
jgi:F0F1-type ATP synthase alpha subunit